MSTQPTMEEAYDQMLEFLKANKASITRTKDVDGYLELNIIIGPAYEDKREVKVDIVHRPYDANFSVERSFSDDYQTLG